MQATICDWKSLNFQPIMGTLRGLVGIISFSASDRQELEEAQNYVASEANKYMENYQGVVPQEYNYAKLEL